MSQPIYVAALALWAPDYPDAQAFFAGAPRPCAEPPAELLPKRVRGRASLLGAMLAEVVGRCAAAAGADVAKLPLIVGSAFGEMDTTAQLLQMMNSADGALSPARFQASVHNAAAGQISIAVHGTGFSTCLAAGEATCAAALTEAYARLALHGGEVLLAVADEALPDVFAEHERFGSLALALLLRARSEGALAALKALRHDAGAVYVPRAVSETAERAGLTGHPAAPLLPLLQAVQERRAAQLVLPASAGTLNLSVEPEPAP